MNFKFLFPSFRNRFVFVRGKIKALAQEQAFDNALNLGTGEGDYDRMIAGYCRQLTGCDVNEEDLQHARAVNQGVMNLHYEPNDALALTYPDASFDLLVSCEVIEHVGVGKPEQMVREIARVLRPGGYAVMTFPSREFPFTYDPVNRCWQWLGDTKKNERLIAQGAYAFGHDYLIGSADFKTWAANAGLEILEFRNLSGYLVGLLEIYWTGIAQGLLKKNARNVDDAAETGGTGVRPTSTKEPALVFLTDFILWLDRILSFWSDRSLGKGVVLRKR
jgi:ubiquinone/menaquinone biosynthesis C-methylase UbiE